MNASFEHLEGKYEILHKLREGGMGAIYKVRHRLLEEVRVVKVMRPQHAGDEHLEERFLREARMANRLRHPNVAQLFDFSVGDDGTAFIVMEFIDGVTVDEIVAGLGPPRLGMALEIARQGLKALAYLHHRGYVHRDISPDNLMVTRDFEGNPLVKLIDLGIAKRLEGDAGLTRTGTFLGKIRYASPEQFQGQGGGGVATLDRRSDLYSFGVMLYELVTGRLPVSGGSVSQLVAGHLFRPPLSFAESDPEGRVPEGLRKVLLRSLAKEPNERFQACEELSEGLVPFLEPTATLGDELERCLAVRDAAGDRAEPLADPGSTQDRLDRQFGLEPAGSQEADAEPTAERVVEVLKALEVSEPSQAPDEAAEEAAGDQPSKAPPAGTSTDSALETLQSEVRAFVERQERRSVKPRASKTQASLDRLMASAGIEEALEALNQVAEDEGDSPRLQELRSEIEAAAEAVNSITDLLDRGRFGAARQALAEALEAHGDAPELRQLGQRLAAAEGGGGDETDPGDRMLEEAVASIRRSMAAGQRDEAQRMIAFARSRFGDRPELAELQAELS